MNSTLTYKCPNCDAGLVFDAEGQVFKCEFCLSSFTEEQLNDTAAAEKAKSLDNENEEFSGEMREYHCPSCGAEVIADKNTAASVCYYCHNPIVMADKVSGAFKPTRIIPFKFTKEEAIDEFLKFAKTKKFIPRGYFSRDQVQHLQGVYYPFWVTDSDTDSMVKGIGRKVRSWRSGDYRYTETTTFAVERRGDIHFEDLSVLAMGDEDRNMLEGILPYPPEEYQEFSMPYLQGFLAKKRNMERHDAFPLIKQLMNRHAEDILRGQVVGYSSFSVNSTDVSVLRCNWEYCLLPVWILTYKKKHKKDSRKDRIFVYSMNGATGKFYGELPVSIPKLILLFLGVLVGVAALAAALGTLFL